MCTIAHIGCRQQAQIYTIRQHRLFVNVVLACISCAKPPHLKESSPSGLILSRKLAFWLIPRM